MGNPPAAQCRNLAGGIALLRRDPPWLWEHFKGSLWAPWDVTSTVCGYPWSKNKSRENKDERTWPDPALATDSPTPVSVGERETWQDFTCDPWPLGWAGAVTQMVVQSWGGLPGIHVLTSWSLSRLCPDYAGQAQVRQALGCRGSSPNPLITQRASLALLGVQGDSSLIHRQLCSLLLRVCPPRGTDSVFPSVSEWLSGSFHLCSEGAALLKTLCACTGGR